MELSLQCSAIRLSPPIRGHENGDRMTNRTITARPPQRPTVTRKTSPRTLATTGQAKGDRTPSRRDASKEGSTAIPFTTGSTRRRVHATVSRSTAAAIRSRTAGSGESNTQTLIAAFASREEAKPPVGVDDPFADRHRGEGREGVYFYFAESEIAHIDELARQGGFGTRSSLIDAVLESHLEDSV